MKKVLSIGLILLSIVLLTGCKEETETKKLIENPEDYYCVNVNLGFENCFENEEAYNNIFVHSAEVVDYEVEYVDIPLNEYRLQKQFTPFDFIEGVVHYEREYDVLLSGNYEVFIYESDESKFYDVEIVEFEDQYSFDTLQDKTVIYGDVSCQASIKDMDRYAVQIDNQFYDLGVLAHFNDIDILELNLEGFDCELGTITIEDVEYFYTYKSDEFDVVSRTQTDDESIYYYSYQGQITCYQSHITTNYISYVYIDGELTGIIDAIEEEIIAFDSLWRYGMKECNLPYTYYNLFEEFFDEEPEYFPMRSYVGEYELYFYNSAIDIYNEYTGYESFEVDGLFHTFTEAHLEGAFSLLVDDEYITLNEALDQEIITLNQLFENGTIYQFIYGYYE